MSRLTAVMLLVCYVLYFAIVVYMKMMGLTMGDILGSVLE